MASRFYLPSTGAPGVSPAISAADWSAHVNVVRRPMNVNNGGSAMTTLTYTPDAADHIVAGRAHFVQFVSQPMPAQSVPAQLVKLQLRAAEANAGNDLFLNWRVYAVSEDGAQVLGVLVAIKADALEAGTTLTNRSDSATSTAFTASTNFRLVLEVGLGGTPVATTGVQGHNGSMSFGESAATDLPEDDVATAALNPWLQFAQNLRLGVGGSNIQLTQTSVCAGGGHVQITALVNGVTHVIEYATAELVAPLATEVIRDTVLVNLRQHFVGRTEASAKAELQAGLVIVV